MLTDADHVWHAMYFKNHNERHRYLKTQLPNADIDHLLRKHKTFPKIYRDDLVEFAVIVNGKVVDTLKTRQEAHDFAKKQTGCIVVVDVPMSERANPKYDRYYQEIIKTPIIDESNINADEEEAQEEQEQQQQEEITSPEETTAPLVAPVEEQQEQTTTTPPEADSVQEQEEETTSPEEATAPLVAPDEEQQEQQEQQEQTTTPEADSVQEQQEETTTFQEQQEETTTPEPKPEPVMEQQEQHEETTTSEEGH